MPDSDQRDLDRRGFLGASLSAGVAALSGLATTAPSGASAANRSSMRTGFIEPAPASYLDPRGFAALPLDTVRMAFVGVGLQGGSHVRNFLRIDGVEIVALCDIDEPRAREVASWITASGRPEPALYTDGEQDWRRLLERDDIDLVFSATPWNWHVPVSVEAMKTGRHAAVEVPAALDLDGCWQLVETAEATERHCVMMENCNYGRREMLILNLVRQGLLGELLHAEGAYIHELRSVKWGPSNEGLWRYAHSVARNANLYPTHGLGPIAQCLDINRGDNFDYLVSMSSPQLGIRAWLDEHLDDDDPRRHHAYALGDMNTSLIKTKRGRTILLQHDTTTPRPYSRLNLVSGTRGTVAGYPDRVFLEEEPLDRVFLEEEPLDRVFLEEEPLNRVFLEEEPLAAGGGDHAWTEMAHYYERFEHPLWKRSGSDASGAGHGGMDYLEDLRLIESLRRGEPMDMDVYDAAALSAPIELTEISNKKRSQPVDFPDFTRGRFSRRHPIGIVG